MEEIIKRFIKKREAICSQPKFSKWLEERNVKVKQQSISQFETGTYKKPPPWLRDVAAAMGLNYEWLITGQGDEAIKEPVAKEPVAKKMTPHDLLGFFQENYDMLDGRGQKMVRGALLAMLNDEPPKKEEPSQYGRSAAKS